MWTAVSTIVVIERSYSQPSVAQNEKLCTVLAAVEVNVRGMLKLGEICLGIEVGSPEWFGQPLPPPGYCTIFASYPVPYVRAGY